MTLNLNKYGSEMQAAWKRVYDLNSDCDWALFGYEGTSFTLKLVATGSEGLDELKEELNANKIMYAFLRVIDPKTSLPKFVFLHWQGESAAGTRKGMCATHLSDIEKYFHGAHVTINARNEDEVDEEEIRVRVSKATASAFNFKEKPSTMTDEAPAPVGTTHQRIVPQKELPSMNEREKFWIQEESRENERIEAEKIRKISERKVIEEERKRREEQEGKAREAMVKERERKISKIRESETTSGGTKESSTNWDKQMVEDLKDEEERQKRSEELRKARNEEARQLISQRSANPRSVFERNTSVGQLNYRKQSTNQDEPKPKPPIMKQTFGEDLPKPKSPVMKQAFEEEQPKAKSPVMKQTFEEEVPKPKSPVSKQILPEDQKPKSPVQQFQERKLASPVEAPKEVEKPKSEVAKSPLSSNKANANMVSTDDIVVPPPDSFGNEEWMKIHAEPDVTSNTHQPDLIQDVAASKSVPDVTSTSGRHTPVQNNGGSASESDLGTCAVALYDYEAADDTEISFDPGQVITHIEQIDQGWWYGFSAGHYGLFPANYVEIIDSSEIEQH